jgi:hypothetical protein
VGYSGVSSDVLFKSDVLIANSKVAIRHSDSLIQELAGVLVGSQGKPLLRREGRIPAVTCDAHPRALSLAKMASGLGGEQVFD